MPPGKTFAEMMDEIVFNIIAEKAEKETQKSQEGEALAKKIETHVAEIVRHKGPMVLPDDMSTEQAITVLQRKLAYDNEDVVVSETFPVFVWDGALALAKALEEQFGLCMQEAEHHPFFGKIPPSQISVEISPTETIKVPWGKFQLPGITGSVSTGTKKENSGRIIFAASAQVKHKDKPAIKKLFDRTREIAMSESIYRGKAIALQFRDKNGETLPIPSPRFIVPANVPVIFNKALETAIETNLLTPIRFAKEVREAKIPLKRGALLAGPYGTGKTLTAGLVARVAIAHGWTFIYVTNVEEISEVLTFAQGFQPAVVFAEDIDRTAGRERTDEVNELLNTLDGIGSKSDEIMTILTTNNPENINPAMRRPGRIDLILPVDPPDQDAAIRLMFHYGKGQIDPTADLSVVGQKVAGQIPAVIREVVERAKLEAIRRAQGASCEILSIDLFDSATSLLAERSLFAHKENTIHPMDPLLETITDRVGKRVSSELSFLRG